MEKNRIAAVVVTFNRKNLLLECLNALKLQTHQLDAIFIIDGPSTDGTPETLIEHEYIIELPPKEYHEFSWKTENVIFRPINEKLLIYYVRIYEDVGGSGGFHEGIKHAYEKGNNWIWLMDDDAEPEKNALEELMKYVNLSDAISLASTVKKPTGEISSYHRGTFSSSRCFPLMQDPLDYEIYGINKPAKIDFASFVGLLIKSDTIDVVGLPKREFFIHHDDVEYCLRLEKIGQIYLVPNSIIIHKEKIETLDLLKKDFLGRDIYRLPYNKLWKIYYGTRNLVYLGNAHSTNRVGFFFELIKRWISSIIMIMLFDDNKLKRIRFITSAYLDGLRGIFDNAKPKRFLYKEKIK